MAEDKYIQFVANYDDWVSIKKLKVEPGMDPRTVMEFLAGLGTGIDGKIEANLRKIIELNKLDAVLNEIEYGKTEDEIAKTLKALNARNVSSVINEICNLPELQKNEIKELVGFCRVYAFRKALNECSLPADYSGVEIPGMKRLKKKKV